MHALPTAGELGGGLEMAQFRVMIPNANTIALQIFSEESLPDGTKIPRLQRETLLTPKAALKIAKQLQNAVLTLEEYKKDKVSDAEFDKLDESDLGSDDSS